MAAKDWEYDVTEKDVDFVNKVNKGMTDLDKAMVSKTGKTKSTGSSAKTPKGGGTTPPPAAPKKPSKVKPPTKPTTPPAPTPGGGGGSAGGSGPKPMSGGHSTSSSRVRGIQDTFKGKYEFVDAANWIRSGGYPGTDAELKSTGKWIQFRDVYSRMKKELKKIKSEEISELRRGYWGGKKVVMKDWVQGKQKIFSKVIEPERDTTEVNVMLALDASGSTGADRQYNMSGVTLGLVKALENTRTKFSLMVYDDSISLVEVDKVGKSHNTMVLAGDYTGMGGNEEAMVLELAQEIVRKNQDSANILIIISDGGVANVKDRIIDMKKKMKNAPFSIYCVGFGSSFDEMHAQAIFGEGYAIGTKNTKDFSDKIVKLIAHEVDIATRQGGM